MWEVTGLLMLQALIKQTEALKRNFIIFVTGL